MRTRNSLARNLTLSLVLGLSLLCCVAGSALYLYAHSRFVRQFDQALIAKARGMAALVQDLGGGRLELDFADELMPEFERSRPSEFFEVWYPDGRVLEHSRSLGAKHLPKFSGKPYRPELRDILLPNGRKARAVGLQFHPQVDDENTTAAAEEKQEPQSADFVTLVVAHDKHSLNETLLTLFSAIGSFMVLVPLSGAVLVWFAVRRGVMPVLRLARQVQEIGPTTLHSRFDDADMPSELLPIATGLNQLLDRVGSAFDRERRFTTDVSHELKTPLAEAMSALSVALKWPEDRALLVKSGRDSLDAMRRMQTLISTLLLLSRAEAGRIELELADVDLGKIEQSCIEELDVLARERSITISQEGENCTRVRSSTVILRSILLNLLRNAVEYSPAGSEVSLRHSTEGEKCSLLVTNPAPEISSEHVKQMFDPFWRKDEARSEQPEHAGLGLTIVASFCRLLNMRLAAELLPNQLLRITLSLTDAAANSEFI